MLDDFTLYWLTNTAVSAARFDWELRLNLYNAAHVDVPAAVSVFPGENYPAPRSWTERAYHKLIYCNQVDRGGHYAAWEQPKLFSEQVRAASDRCGVLDAKSDLIFIAERWKLSCTACDLMLRDKNLIPLSHQHQRALALCVRIERASPINDGDAGSWQSEIAQHWQSEIEIHFAAEEKLLFPAARRFHELEPLVQELTADHAMLRKSFSAAMTNKMSSADLTAFARTLSTHIRKEERQLFEPLQKLIDPRELALLGRQLEEALKDAVQACALPAKTKNS